MNTAQATGASQTSAVMIRKACRMMRETLSGRFRTGRVSSVVATVVTPARSSWKLFHTKTMIGMIEKTIRITAIAEP